MNPALTKVHFKGTRRKTDYRPHETALQFETLLYIEGLEEAVVGCFKATHYGMHPWRLRALDYDEAE